MLKYHSLRDKVFSLKNLYAAFQHVKKNKGKAGLDRVSIRQFESNLDVILSRIQMNTNNPVEASYPGDFFLVIFQCHQSVH